MKLILILIPLLLTGCVRAPDKIEEGAMIWYVQNNVEPDSETIMAYYEKYGEVATNEMRIREGW